MKVALYIRIANDDAGNAISYQEQELRRWSNEHGHEVVDVFKDNAPGVLAECFELQRLLAQLSARTFDGVVVRRLDRLSRNYYDLPHLADKFQKAGVKIIVPDDTDDAFAECEMGFHILNALKSTWEPA
ncbi:MULTISPECIES: recombinase family protein [Oscillospiraceae]|jgi:resolvase, N terminal domain|uniref:recombinase family protein n=1 Tax=Oscillospiraceae TaxID=216572 RepID=UPI000E64FD16